jgi:hypothetical protein
LLDTFHPLPGSPLSGGCVSACGSRWVVIHLFFQSGDLILCFNQTLHKCWESTERGCSGTGPDSHAIDGDPVEIDQALFSQYSDRVSEHSVKKCEVVGAEIGQRVVVDSDPTT